MKKLLFTFLMTCFLGSGLFAFDPQMVEVPSDGDAKMFARFDRDIKKLEVNAAANPAKASIIKNFLKLVSNIDESFTKAIVKAEKNGKDSCRYDKTLMYLREWKKLNEIVGRINEIYSKVGAVVPKTSEPVKGVFSVDFEARIQEATRLSLETHYVIALDIEGSAKKIADKQKAIPHYLRILALDKQYKDVKVRSAELIKNITMNTILVIDEKFNTLFNDSQLVQRLTDSFKSIGGEYNQYFTQEDLGDFQDVSNIKEYFSIERMRAFAEAQNIGNVGAVLVLMNVEGKGEEPKDKVKKIEIARYVLPDGSSIEESEWKETVQQVQKISKEIERAKKKGTSESQIEIEFQTSNPQLYASYKAYGGQINGAKREVVAVLEMVTTTRNFNLKVKDAYLITEFTNKKPKFSQFKLNFPVSDSVIWYRLSKGTMEELNQYAPEYADWYAANNSNEDLKTEADFLKDIKGQIEKLIPEMVIKEMKRIKR